MGLFLPQDLLPREGHQALADGEGLTSGKARRTSGEVWELLGDLWIALRSTVGIVPWK